ncbi:MAG TPA: MFS transporter [Candidatus Limihabitans stercoravium]|nr:MFS transporter [Candidatus Limihabitans stercoravium]
MEGKKLGLKTWLLIWGLGIAGQLCWNIENQWFNTFIYAKIAKDPSIISWMVGVSATATTFATFFFGTLSDRLGKRKPFIAWGYIIWGICTIGFGLTEFIPKEHLIVAAVMVVVADAVMSFFGSMGNDAGFNAWSNDLMCDGNRGQIGAVLATQPVIGTIVGTLVGGALIGTEENYMLLFLVMGGIVIAVGVLTLFTMKEPGTLQPHVEGSFWKQFASVFNFKKFFSYKELVLVNVCVAVFFIGFNVYFVHMGNYMLHYLGFNEGDMGLMQGIGLILAMLMVIPAIFLINRNKTPLVCLIAIVVAIVGLMWIYFIVKPQNVDPTSAFAVLNLPLIVGVFLVGVGYVVIVQSTTVWAKALYPADSKGQFEGVRIVFFVLIPMIFGSIIATPTIKLSGLQIAGEVGMEYIPNENIFLVGAIVSVLAIIPLLFAWKLYKKRVSQS